MYAIRSYYDRFDIFWTALRHLAMPVFTLSLFHWATLGRVNRSRVLSEKNSGEEEQAKKKEFSYIDSYNFV